MPNKIISFKESLEQEEKREQQEKGTCEHCEIKFDLVASFLTIFHSIIEKYDGEEANQKVWEFVGSFYDDVYDEGKRAALEDIIGYAGFTIDEIDGIEE